MTREALEQHGFAGPIAVFDEEECARLLSGFRAEGGRAKTWGKGWVAASPAFHRVATDPRILDLVRPVLGDDIVVWGASLIVKAESAIHPFHTDVESMDPAGGFATVWIGLENTDRSSGLKFVPGSHRYGVTIQELNHRTGLGRGESTDETTLEAARRHDGAAEIVQPEVADGEALVFDGRVWHGSHNLTTNVRTALLVQYARADRPVRIPRTFDWPIAFRRFKRPPVVVVSGKSPAGVNRVVRAPRRSRRVGNGIHLLPGVPEQMAKDHAAYPHLRGRTPSITEVGSHSSILAPGASPHRLHQHIEEEVLVVVSGTARVQAADNAAGTVNAETAVMEPGDFAYYPAGTWHTITNVGDEPLRYTMLKWVNYGRPRDRRAAPRAFVRAGEAIRTQPTGIGGTLWRVRTRWLRRLAAHVSVLEPGGGYDPHADRYDVAILLLEGTVETLDRKVAAPALLYHPAGAQHGIRNVGTGPVRYLVFELSGRPSPFAGLARMSHRSDRRYRIVDDLQ
ncbi:cupin domain-containing protein [Devosia sp. ZB163]|uniref:cupin domain-containing protein n=1 Tax=Devosia sp. ZB163 TaxID=3025938 RepID=UPI002360A0B1|nr:cupin domain-containing protein [Devosia sp. ZB163]MDC9822950.1 cupin domain-containing protein [Devosia sp. ZB163]